MQSQARTAEIDNKPKMTDWSIRREVITRIPKVDRFTSGKAWQGLVYLSQVDQPARGPRGPPGVYHTRATRDSNSRQLTQRKRLILKEGLTEYNGAIGAEHRRSVAHISYVTSVGYLTGGYLFWMRIRTVIWTEIFAYAYPGELWQSVTRKFNIS